MKQTTTARRLASLFMALCMLAAPLPVSAKKGEKNYKAGLNHEKMEQWEQAAQEYALAVATNPADMEYQLHYRRALFNASQKFMDQGRALSEQGDYAGAYNAFRQAYGYDPVNELAVAEMNRVLRLQREKEGVNGTTTRPSAASGAGGGGAATVPASYDATGAAQGGRVAAQAVQALPPTRSEQLRVINYNGDLEEFVRKMAEELGLNVIFDRDFPKRAIKVNLRDVTAARALDHIFIAQNLFFQKLDRRTVLVADAGKRGQYQQLMLRTFYLTNIDPQNARNLIQAALPPNAGRQPLVTPNKETNSITVRDTPENIRLIEELIRAIDKDRAEVVMDVNIYEVSRTNLLQLGNQVGSAASLGGLGGFNPLSILVGGPNGRGLDTSTGGTKGGGTKTLADAAAVTAVTALGGAFILPATQLSLFQSRDNSRLLAHTQVHAFDGEQSVTRIGQKVPIQTAQVTPFGGINTGTGTATGGTNGVFGGNGYPVIQYQDTGLNLKFTPQVFPNQDVEVKMEIESNDVIGGATALTPTFSQRTMSGKARIPNGRTVMIASVAQDKQSRGRQGLPLLGLIPVLGRLFSTPTDNSSNADIVITVSPRVLSAPVVTPDDIQTRDAGTLQAPISDSLEAVVKAAEREEQLAAARHLPTHTAVQVNFDAPTEAKATETAANHAQPAAPTSQPNAAQPPVAEASAPAYVPAPQILSGAANSFAPAAATNASVVSDVKTASGAYAIPVINTDDAPPPVPAVALKGVAAAEPAPDPPSPNVAAPQPQAGGAALHLLTGGEMRVGERRRVLVLINTTTPLSLAAAALKFNPRILAVRSITQGSLFGDAQGAQPSLTRSVDPRGSLLALVAPSAGSTVSGAGVLLFIEVEALAAGESLIGFDGAGLYLMAADGKAVAAQTSQARLTVK
ncbi:MAG TPA: secretin N-terminal domain-containing protein [Pyrinomonadaceae bacterium]|jgi:general secretion pathway protein D|nr:secretin N-terminal domain-containing protein [Pyrinomonadaceae bacterium]